MPVVVAFMCAYLAATESPHLQQMLPEGLLLPSAGCLGVQEGNLLAVVCWIGHVPCFHVSWFNVLYLAAPVISGAEEKAPIIRQKAGQATMSWASDRAKAGGVGGEGRICARASTRDLHFSMHGEWVVTSPLSRS